MEGSDKRPHALLLPYPAQGHINPMMQLGKRLAALGVRVTLATIQHVHAKILRAQQALAQPISDSHLDFRLEGIPDGLPDELDREVWNEELGRVIDETLEEGALEVVHMLASQGRPVTVIVGDFFLRWTHTLAQRAALPEFIFWPQCASVFSIYFHLDSIISSGYHPYEANVRATSSREDCKHMVACIPGLPRIHPADLPFEMPFGKIGLDWVRNILEYRFCHIGKAQGLIINSFRALEERLFEALHYEIQLQKDVKDLDHKIPSLRFLGPLVPSSFGSKGEQMTAGGGKLMENAMSGASLWEEEVEECMQWLDGQPHASVVLVAFGSLTITSADQMQELAAGLIASGQRVLWVIRKDSIKRTKPDDIQELAQAPSLDVIEALPAGFLEANKHICKVVRWAPQALVLSHPSVGGFFSHCGWNSTLDGICAGVPILGWPWLMDQITNCWLLSHVWNIGLTLPRSVDNVASKEDIERSVKQLMEGPQALDMRARAQELSKMAREAVLESPLLQSFIDDIKKYPVGGNGRTHSM